MKEVVRWPTPSIATILTLTGQYLAAGRDEEAYSYLPRAGGGRVGPVHARSYGRLRQPDSNGDPYGRTSSGTTWACLGAITKG